MLKKCSLTCHLAQMCSMIVVCVSIFKAMMEKSTLVIVGLGLLGSSLAAALKSQGWTGPIVGVSSPASCERALELGICDQCFAYDQIDTWKPLADLILYCTPIEQIKLGLEALASSGSSFKPGVVISDVGSTKAEICQFANQILGSQAAFVGGHPMAGSEKSGIAGVDPHLYESALWILCPNSAQNTADLQLLQAVIDRVGGRSLVLDPSHHDALVARISHVPQLISSLIASTAGIAPESLEVAGPGFRDMSRLALSNYAMWKSILETNQAQVAQVLEDFNQGLQKLNSVFQSHPLDLQALEAHFECGRSARAQLNIPLPQFRQGLCDVIVQIPDSPGQIAAVVQCISTALLDIRDIELMRVRDGVGGTLRLAFKNRTEAEKAILSLEKASFKSWLKAI